MKRKRTIPLLAILILALGFGDAQGAEIELLMEAPNDRVSYQARAFSASLYDMLGGRWGDTFRFFVKGWVCGHPYLGDAVRQVLEMNKRINQLDRLVELLALRSNAKAKAAGMAANALAPLTLREMDESIAETFGLEFRAVHVGRDYAAGLDYYQSEVQAMARDAEAILQEAERGSGSRFQRFLTDIAEKSPAEPALESTEPDGTQATYVLTDCYRKEDLDRLKAAEVEVARKVLATVRKYESVRDGLLKRP